jgi:hypothetical protein
VEEEMKEIEDEQNTLRKLKPYLFKEEEGSDSYEESEEDSLEESEEGEEGRDAINKAVDRTKIKPKRIRNKELKIKEEEKQREKKRDIKQ